MGHYWPRIRPVGTIFHFFRQERTSGWTGKPPTMHHCRRHLAATTCRKWKSPSIHASPLYPEIVEMFSVRPRTDAEDPRRGQVHGSEREQRGSIYLPTAERADMQQ